MKIILIPALSDNYIYLGIIGDKAFVVDPAEEKSVFECLKQNKIELTHILCTHHHSDHIEGVEPLKKATKATVIGPDDSRIPFLDETVNGGDSINILGLQGQVLFLPGHTSTHIAYYFPSEDALFCGDVLFAAGCGRLFEGTPDQMFASLNTLAALPDTTKVYCGHEYTLKNLDFALKVDPKNGAIPKRIERAQALRKNEKPTLPSTLVEEKQTNPFLRCSNKELKAAHHWEEASDLEVFTRLREMRNIF